MTHVPEETRAALIDALAKGHQISEACGELDIHTQTAWGLAQLDPQWRERLDEALMEGRPEAPHGTTVGYRQGCRCPECRDAKYQAGHWRKK